MSQPTALKLAIIGSGPAGYTAATYAARAMLEPVVFTGLESGGQLMYTTELENFPGFPEGVRGPVFMQNVRQQAARFGANIQDVSVAAVDFSVRPFKIWTTLPDDVAYDWQKSSVEEQAKIRQRVVKQLPDYLAESVVISTGAEAIRLGIPGESKLFGKGVSTCAVCDAAFYKDKNVYVVGGGDSAMEDSLALIKFAKSVTLVHRRDSFKASKIMQDRVLTNPKVKVIWNAAVTQVDGTDSVESVTIKTEKSEKKVPAEGLFLAIGHKPMTSLFDNQIELDAHGYVVTRMSYTKSGLSAAQAALDTKGLVAFPTMTSVEGVFAAGDVVDVRYKQAITAAGMGCMAALDAERWLENQSKA